jgi:hypothetical protein
VLSSSKVCGRNSRPCPMAGFGIGGVSFSCGQIAWNRMGGNDHEWCISMDLEGGSRDVFAGTILTISPTPSEDE